MSTKLAVFTVALIAAAGIANAGNGHGHGPGGHATGRPGRGVSKLSPPEGAVDARQSGRVDVRFFPAKGDRVERSWMRFRLKHLTGATQYTLWMDDPTTPDDPTLVQVGVDPWTTSDGGAFHVRADTKDGGTMPFGATLADLAGKAVEVRDGLGAVVLVGAVPVMK